MEHNFIDDETGDKFFISSYKIGFSGANPVYKDKDGNVLKNPKNGNELNLIPKKIEKYENITIFGTREDRQRKDIAHYAKVANNHNKSEEVRHLKKKNVAKQMGVSISEATYRIEDAKKDK